MKFGKYAHLALAFSISVILITVTAVAVNTIYAHDRANISHHITTRLQATAGILDLWQHDFLTSVRSIAEDPTLVDLVDDLLRHKISDAEASKTLDQWLRPIYLARGYEGHSIITPDYKIILSSSPAYTGKQVASPVSKDTIGRAFRTGTGIGRPSEAVYQVQMLNKVVGPGTLFQLGCARINDESKTLAVLCLRQDPYRNFFAMLATGFSGSSGEAYAVDRNGFIISPTRFGNTVIRTKNRQTDQIEVIKGLQARVPRRTKTGSLQVDPATSPLTTTVALAINKGESGFIDGYEDYRDVAVVGAVKWIPDMDIGIAIEQDVDEVYGPFHFSRNAIIGLALLAIILINMLIIVQVRGRKSLAEREQRMRAFLDNFPGLAHMRDSKGQFLIANKHMEEFFNMENKDIVGQSQNTLPLPKKYLDQLNQDHEEVLRTGNVVETIKDFADMHYANVEWLKTIRFPVIDTETNAIYAVGTILLDISEQTRTARELDIIRQNLEKMVEQRTAQFEAAKLEAEQAARAKSDFLANMSHEIRTPMNAIIGLSHLATLVSEDPKLRSYLQRIHHSSSHLLSIINDILDFSKIEAGKMTLECVDFSLEDMLNNVIGLLWEKADDKGLELLLQIDPDIPDNLHGDALRIGQILINFTSNAVKFTETGDVVVRVHTVSETSDNLRLRFDVQDTGIGIPAERFEQLFKPFHQLDTSSTRRFEGTGLGLTISKNLVELMDGQLDIHSEPGVGSTFSLELTLAKGAAQELIGYRHISLQGFRVLVVDDNEHARKILATMLHTLALEVTEVDSGLAAIGLVESQHALGQPFDIVFLDWKMPGISGIETAARINGLELTTPPTLILVSAHSKHDPGVAAEHLLGAVLAKPVTPSALYDTLTNLLKNTCIKHEQQLPLDLPLYKNLANITVLLVDDNDINQDVVKELLNLVGTNVITATNGQQALDVLGQTPIDIVLMDMQMPVMDGMEATRRIRAQEQFATLPIIAMTANALSGDRERCLNAGMNYYISKPINPEILFRTLLRCHNTISDSTLHATYITHDTGPAPAPALAKLYRIAGLEVDQALERLLNNDVFYLTLIERFINERSDIVDVIESALTAHNIDEASRQAHTFKSLAGTVGANLLQELALQVEMGLQEGEDVSSLLMNLRTELNTLVLAVRSALTP